STSALHPPVDRRRCFEGLCSVIRITSISCFVTRSHSVSCWILLVPPRKWRGCVRPSPGPSCRPKRVHVLVIFVAALLGAAPVSAAQNAPATRSQRLVPSVPPTITIPRLSHPPSIDDFLTMQPQGEIALQMAKITGFTQRDPHDGEPVTEPTDAYLGYDQKNFYAVFVCFDDPGKVRARMSRREDIFDDDQIEVILDTFHDRRRAYAFQVTPLGVQWDAIYTEASREEQTQGHFDTSFDTVWDSKGKVTSRGYVVWLAI